MKNTLTKNLSRLILLLLFGASYTSDVQATQLSGTYYIDSNGVASTTVFKNLQSAITYLTSSGTRTDGGPANVAPFGVSGPVEFIFAPNSGPYQNLVSIPAITGTSAVNTITINGNGNTLQALGDANNRAVVLLQGVTYLTIKNLTIKTLDVTYGWGIQFKSASNYNTIDSCIIDIGSVTSTTAANSAGIVFSSSATTPTTAAANGYFNTISNNQLLGNPTGAGMYYGIVGAPATGGTILSANRFVNNTILNYYSYGIYWVGSNSTLIKRNKIARTTKTSFTTTYGIYLSSASRRDTIEANEITGAFNGSPTSTSTFYGIYVINYSGTSTEPNFIFNNIIHNNKGNGSLTGINALTSFNTRYYNNTISFENQSATSTTAAIQGAYFTGTTSATNQLDFRNNIFNITQSSTGPKCGLMIASAQTAGLTLDKNNYYGTGATYASVNYNGADYTLASWQLFAPAYDQNSRNYNPQFVDLPGGNLSPRDIWYDVAGDVIAMVKTYFNGTQRITPPMGIGAFKGTIPSTDASLSEITKPTAPYTAGSYPIGVKIRNAGSNTLTSATINWSVNGIAQTPVPFSGSIAAGSVSATIPLNSIPIAFNTLYKIDAEVVNPNGLVDSATGNNSYTEYTAANIVAGTYTLNAGAPAGATNFTSLKTFADIANIGGQTGAVTLNVTPNSGPYTEQVTFNKVAGATVTTPITINGNGEYIQFNNTISSIGVVNLIGTDHITFNQLNVRSLNTSYGVGYLLTLGADSNTINNCTIDISSVTGGSASAGIAVTGTLTSPTSSNSFCIANRFTNNTITGGPSGGPYYGISINVNSTTGSADNRYVVANNIIKDFTIYGIYSGAVIGSRFSNNKISRPLKTSASTFYGIYFSSNATGDTIENNLIYKPADNNIATTSGIYGIYLTGINAQSGRNNIVRNNIVTDIRTNGLVYGIYCSSVSYTQFLHNTIAIDDPLSISTGVTYGFYSTGTPTLQVNRNNIYYINRGGTANKASIYLNTVSATGYVISNNVYHIKSPLGSTTNYLGYYNAVFINDLASWNTAVTFDANSVSADPLFRSYMTNAPLTPAGDSLSNSGFNTAGLAPLDYAGKTRSATPDRGAYEFLLPANDAGLAKFTSPVFSQVTLGSSVNIEVQVKNYGKGTLTSADLNWRVDTTLQTPTPWSGILTPNDTANAWVGSYYVGTSGVFPVKVWSSNPNFSVDSIGENDTISMVLCTPLSGTVTLNPALPGSATNFTTFANFAKVISNCGVNGDLTLMVSPGVYNEQISFTGRIPGAGVASKITIDGGDSALTVVKHDGSIKRATLVLDNVSNLIFKNMRFEATSLTAGTAVQLMTNADSNTFTRCTFIAPYSTSTAVNAFIASGSLTSATTQGAFGNYLLIDSCTSQGGYYCIDLYGMSTQKPIGAVVQNSVVRNAHFYGIYSNYQDGIRILNNKVFNIGVAGNNSGTTIASISVLNSNNGIRVMGNEIQNMLGGRGIQMVTNIGTSLSPIVVANNMVNIGDALFTTYGIFENNNAFADIAYNTVKLNTAESGYAGAAFYTNNTDAVTYNTVKVVNNIFTAPNGSLAVYIVSGTNLLPALYTLDYNVYFSSGTYPFRVAGFITNTYAGFVTGTPNMLGTYLPANNAHGQFFMPTFFSSTNLRSINPELDDSATALSTVTTDFDGNMRNFSTPDIGIKEFSKPGADAGVVQILSPTKPMNSGLNDIVVVVKNFGSNALFGFDVHYTVETTTRTLSYTGSLAPNATDTLIFDSTSGPGATDQRYNFSGNLVSLKSWTSNPNGVADSLNNNDTSFTSICGSLNGTYTINPSGSGSSNFVSFQAAIDKLTCGGISGPVVFDIAPGVYNNQITIPTIAGTSAINTVTFKAANNIASSVTITTNTGNAATNYTVRLLGARNIRFENLTLTNTDPTYSRILAINKEPSTNLNTTEIVVRGCSFTGNTIASTADQYALVWGPTGDNATFLTFTNNSFTNGSIGISIGGQNIVNQNAPGLTIDSNVFNNQYYASMWLQNRFQTQIRGNMITGHPTYTGYYGIYVNGFGTASEISRNQVINPAGNYGIYVGQNSYYDAPGLTVVHNNLVQMLGTGTQYGLYLTNSSKMRYYNNTVRLFTASTSSFAFYFSGHASFVNGTTTYPASYDVSVVNNILTGTTGYALYTFNIQANTALSDVNNNLYYTGFTTPLYLNAVTYTPAQFYTNYRNALYSGSDSKSLFGNLTFNSASSFIPSASNTSAWLVNGRGRHLATNSDKDYAGNPRSIAPVTGVPDIGAYEIAPTSTPVSGVFTDSISYGLTQYLVEYADTVASITWGFAGTLPTSIDGKFYPGTLVSNPSAYALPAGKTAMDMFVRLNATGGSFYAADVKLYYESAMLGTVPSETDIITARRNAGVWTNYPFGQTILDTVAKTFVTNTLSDLGDFTGTDALNALPVKLQTFEAKASGKDAVIYWTTSSEVNLSGYIVERSTDNIKFTEVGKVKPTGSTTKGAKYQLIDPNVKDLTKANRVYYRLKMVDRDGTFERSGIRMVEFKNTTTKPKTLVYPNPFAETLNLVVQAEVEGTATIEVFDIYGKQVYKSTRGTLKGANTLTIDELQSLPKGIYYVRLSGLSDTDESIKLLKD